MGAQQSGGNQPVGTNWKAIQKDRKQVCRTFVFDNTLQRSFKHKKQTTQHSSETLIFLKSL